MSSRTILHVDMDSFFASVEQQANPRLRGIPIAVSGDPKSRTVVAAASKEAKRFGVRSAMTIGEARALCPQIQFVLGDPAKYVEVSRRIIAILGSFTPDVEVFSIDEAFLDVTGWGNAVHIAQEIKRRVREEVGEWITCSIGIAPNKRLAKLASEFDKPDGIVIVTDGHGSVRLPAEASAKAGMATESTDDRIRVIARSDLLASLKLRDLCGIGARIEARLHAIGITTIGQLAAAPLDCLVGEFGSYGYELHDMALGLDRSSVDAGDHDPKSMGHATTLPRDLRSLAAIRPVVEELSEKVAARLRRHGFRGSIIHVTIRFRDFTSRSEQTTIPDATDDGLRISRAVMRVLGEWAIRIPVRLIGVSIGKLVRAAPIQVPLFPRDQRWQSVTAAMDVANDRYGDWTVQRASLLAHDRVAREVAAAFRATAHLKESGY
ncbi:DNA polymerase IV [Candidatus Uhrbacteria bacterium]|nr:DNA polymerase IV [Candidatus Uhrbacteria bacterium]